MKREILKHLPPSYPWGDRVQVYEALESTNTHAVRLARDGAPEGTAVIARQQTAGRGRMGRSFLSRKDAGLYLSLILRPGCKAVELMHLTCAVAVAVCDAIERLTGVRPGIKWINDLVLGRRKIAGILTELGFRGDGTVDYAVIGIGINVAGEDFPEELRGIAGSLEGQLGNAPSLPALAAAVLAALRQMDLRDQEAIMARYRQDCLTVGSGVRVISPAGSREALALSVTREGALLVRYPDGQEEAVQSGEVSVRGLWDYI